MLAGTVYFYRDNKIIEEMDLDDYDEMGKEKFIQHIKNIKAQRVVLGAIYHGQQIDEHMEEIYNEVT